MRSYRNRAFRKGVPRHEKTRRKRKTKLAAGNPSRRERSRRER